MAGTIKLPHNIAKLLNIPGYRPVISVALADKLATTLEAAALHAKGNKQDKMNAAAKWLRDNIAAVQAANSRAQDGSWRSVNEKNRSPNAPAGDLSATGDLPATTDGGGGGMPGWLVLLAVVGTLAVAGGGFYVYKKRSTPAEVRANRRRRHNRRRSTC